MFDKLKPKEGEIGIFWMAAFIPCLILIFTFTLIFALLTTLPYSGLGNLAALLGYIIGGIAFASIFYIPSFYILRGIRNFNKKRLGKASK